MANPVQNILAAGQIAAPTPPVQAQKQLEAQAMHPIPGIALANLPVHTEWAAPTFNETHSQDLERYFSDL